jgi:hypothetical protein
MAQVIGRVSDDSAVGLSVALDLGAAASVYYGLDLLVKVYEGKRGDAGLCR